MSSVGTLWTTPASRHGKIILAAAAVGGITLDVPADYKHYEDNKKPPFLSKFPHGKIPALEMKDGFCLFESTPVAKYVASLAPNAGLLGGDAKEVALVDQWLHFADNEISTFTVFISVMMRGVVPYNKSFHTTLVDLLVRSLTTLNNHLATRTFCVHERITLADISLASAVHGNVDSVIDAEMRAKIPNVIRHMETVANQPKIKDIFGPIEYCEKAKQFTPPAKEKKEKEPKPAAAPKAEKKPKAKAAEDDGEDEPLVPEEPKAKNPLDSLPKSTLVLDDWKRAYSNKDTGGPEGSIAWLYQNFDKEGYSIWRVDFKYNSELTQVFMSSNQIGGFFNRLEASRKYLFGTLGVLGTANDSVISGAFILRGQDVKAVVDVAPDFESYEYKKLDIENANDKTFLEAALDWTLEVDGKKWADGKIFK